MISSPSSSSSSSPTSTSICTFFSPRGVPNGLPSSDIVLETRTGEASCPAPFPPFSFPPVSREVLPSRAETPVADRAMPAADLIDAAELRRDGALEGGRVPDGASIDARGVACAEGGACDVCVAALAPCRSEASKVWSHP
eukprot:CAMPEP_0180240620 /NCGR_PEP_ID=MMETSP0987-20121128/32205_1 /TAXON_ID=697907 /ORGANISM="non described non described, Strain CCMP2293" /LENGTH=139 /DNA_ID=CAMNT_0022207515 /DNA_START=298 /DNA_END=715 /DNA_ORIENTATION=+